MPNGNLQQKNAHQSARRSARTASSKFFCPQCSFPSARINYGQLLPYSRQNHAITSKKNITDKFSPSSAFLLALECKPVSRHVNKAKHITGGKKVNLLSHAGLILCANGGRIGKGVNK